MMQGTETRLRERPRWIRRLGSSAGSMTGHVKRAHAMPMVIPDAPNMSYKSKKSRKAQNDI
jgi:hypothetical protein